VKEFAPAPETDANGPDPWHEGASRLTEASQRGLCRCEDYSHTEGTHSAICEPIKTW
jgi:hypothetical protein